MRTAEETIASMGRTITYMQQRIDGLAQLRAELQEREARAVARAEKAEAHVDTLMECCERDADSIARLQALLERPRHDRGTTEAHAAR